MGKARPRFLDCDEFSIAVVFKLELSRQHYLYEPKSTNSPNDHQLMNGEENVVCLYNGILFGHTDSCYNIDVSWKHRAK